MGRYRSRSYSPRRRSRTPPRRKLYDEPRDRHRSSYSHRDRRSPAPSGLLVRNVSLDTRPEDLRIPFEKFGPVKDVYLPRNYYTGEPRGFGFVKFRYPEDAAEAKDRLNHTIIGGREIRIVYAEENRKTPQEMRKVSRMSNNITLALIFSGRYGGRRTPLRSPRRRYRSYSRSPSLGRRYSRSVSRSRSSRSERDYRSSQRSLSPRESSPVDGRGHRARERSQSPRNNSPYDAEYESRKSYSPRGIPSDDDDYRSIRRSRSSREISLHDRKDLRSSQRSVSPRDESPRSMEYNPKQNIPMSRDVSPCNEDKRSNRRSPVDSRDSRLNYGSLSHGENGRSPLLSRDLSSGRSISPRKNGGSLSRSHSRSYSPR